jgi:hypothetical protein
VKGQNGAGLSSVATADGCEWKEKLRSHNTSYCLIEVVTKAGLIVYLYLLYTRLPILSSCIYFVPSYVFFYLAAHILFFGHSFIVLNYKRTKWCRIV